MPGQKIGETVYDYSTFESNDSSKTPWSIWVANANSGNAHRVWTARPGIGHAFYPSSSTAQLWWMTGDHIAFTWEADGWPHIYAVSANGGPATRLTTGAFEVETVVASLDHSHLLYATNEGAIDERHIWSVGLDGRPKALTHGPENQWFPTALANGGLAYVDAWYAAPPVVTIAGTPPKTLVAVQTPANYPQSQMVRPQLITYKAPDGWTIHAQLFVPRGAKSKMPAIVFDHGGPPRQMLGGYHYMEPYTHLYEMNQYLANRGFVVLSINYRLGIMYGYKFRNPPQGGWHGGSEYQDVLAGAKWLQKQSYVDPNRIGIYGLSYGGLLTALALARNSDVFKVGADFAGVHDWASAFDHDYGQSGRYTGAAQDRAHVHCRGLSRDLEVAGLHRARRRRPQRRVLAKRRSCNQAALARRNGGDASLPGRSARELGLGALGRAVYRGRSVYRAVLATLARETRRYVDERVRLFPELAKALVVRLPRVIALVYLLQNCREAKNVEDMIPAGR